MEDSLLHNIFRSMLSTYRRAFAKVLLFLFSWEEFIRAIEQALNEARLSRLRASLKSCGKGFRVQFPITITEPDMVEVGEEVSLAAYVHIWGGGRVWIGDRVMIGTHTSISSLTHNYQEERMYETLIREPVIIEDDVWIGSNCVILPGVKVGRGAVIGAGSVVTKHIQPHSVVFGVPAQPHGER